jgi:hypothetical protein
MTTKSHPWASSAFPGALVCDAESRLALVKQSTDADWLERVIGFRNTQKSVRLAAERRLRWVNKACAGLLAKYHQQNPEAAS